MEKLGFTQVLECKYLFTNRQIIVFFYIDDIVIMVYPQFRQDYLNFKAKLTKAYKMRDIGELKWFLGIYIVWDYLQRRI
jgi:hypothetical protein